MHRELGLHHGLQGGKIRGRETLWGCVRSTERREGYAIHMYTANRSMDSCCLSNADGDLLIVPQQGRPLPLWSSQRLEVPSALAAQKLCLTLHESDATACWL